MSPENISNLPGSKGSYTGSILYDEWVYNGSNDDADLFKYTWNEGAFLKSKKIQIKPKIIDFELPYSKKIKIAVEPIYESNKLIGFKRIESASSIFNNKAIDKFLSEN